MPTCRPADLPTYRHTGTGRKSTPSFGSGPVIRRRSNWCRPADLPTCRPADLPSYRHVPMPIHCNIIYSGGRQVGRHVYIQQGYYQCPIWSIYSVAGGLGGLPPRRLMTGPLPKDGVDFRPVPVGRQVGRSALRQI